MYDCLFSYPEETMLTADGIDIMDENDIKLEPLIDINEAPITDGMFLQSLMDDQVCSVFIRPTYRRYDGTITFI